MVRLFKATALCFFLLVGFAAPASAQDAKHCVTFTRETNSAGGRYVIQNNCGYDVQLSACLLGGGRSLECGAGSGYYRWSWYFDVGERVGFGDGRSAYRFGACRDHPTVYGDLEALPDGRYNCMTPKDEYVH